MKNCFEEDWRIFFKAEDNATIIDLVERISFPQGDDENSGGCQEITTEKKDSSKSDATGRIYCKNIFDDRWRIFALNCTI